MELEFSKLHGLGNDFVFVDDLAGELELTTEQVAWLCDRHFGIGADGVIMVRPPQREGSVAWMHYINADGSLAQMCGNGVRCFAKWLVDRGVVDPAAGELTADTLAGQRPISFQVDDEGKMTQATVDMGAPILEPAAVPTNLAATFTTEDGTPCAREAEIPSPWGAFAFTCVSMGNPHAICFVDDFAALPDELFAEGAEKSLDTLRLDEIGAYYERHEAFPEKTNVEFACVADDGHLRMRVFERGCGETLACGTGACATLTSAVLTGRSGRENTVELKGGTLSIVWDEDGHIKMTGPATESFAGTVTV